MPKKKTVKIEDRIPPDVLEAIDEAAAEIAADTNLTRAEARDRILARLGAKAEAADAGDVDDAAEEVEEEEEEETGQRKGKGNKVKNKSKSVEDDDDDDDEEDDEDETDEKPPPSHWSSKPLFGKRK